jgi:hypothetical protein
MEQSAAMRFTAFLSIAFSSASLGQILSKAALIFGFFRPRIFFYEYFQPAFGHYPPY